MRAKNINDVQRSDESAIHGKDIDTAVESADDKAGHKQNFIVRLHKIDEFDSIELITGRQTT